MKQLKIVITSRFKKDYKDLIKRGRNPELLQQVISTLTKGEKLPEKYKDHVLVGNWVGYRECHIQPDWLLIYKVQDNILVLLLARTGSHSDLF